MTIAEFTPYSGFIGGLSIGLASAVLALASGRIAGISGIVARVLMPIAGDWSWRFTFLVGIILGAAAAMHWVPSAMPFEITDSPVSLIGGGLLVGFGTQLGGGCTSGHGVCGIARMSRRSLVAVPVFMLVAMITAFVATQILGGE
jgi:uncharacterized protein